MLLLLSPLLLCASSLALTVPPPLVHDAALIAASQARARAGDPATLAEVATAVRRAEAALSAGPFSVTANPHPAPDGDVREYYSIAKYYWPCDVALTLCGAKPPSHETCGADGLPWLDCDGHVNPIIDEYSYPIVANMSAAVCDLASGYLFSGRADLAARAALLLRTFFTDARLGMRPSLDFAQAEPGTCNGSHWGIIELSGNFVECVLDSVSFIAPSGAWTDADQAAFLAWLAGMAAWLRGSANGKQEAVAFNNHQIWYTVMSAGIDVWLGDTAHAVALLRGTLEPPPAGNAFAPLGVQIAPDGELPAEEARTNSGGYVNFATTALLQLGLIARTPALAAAGAPDLLSYTTHSNHSSIKMAVDFMVPFVSGQNTSWPFKNITKTPWSIFTEQFRRAANVDGWNASHATYAATVAALHERADDSLALFWPLDAAAAAQPDAAARA